MIHPVVKLIATRPDLLAAHASGYAELAAAEAGEAVSAIKRRAVLTTAAVVLAGVAVGLTGIALLMLAALPTAGMPAPWALAVIPLSAWVAAAVCGALARRQETPMSFEAVRAQWAADAELLSQAQRA
jgi:hypothetical protein